MVYIPLKVAVIYRDLAEAVEYKLLIGRAMKLRITMIVTMVSSSLGLFFWSQRHSVAPNAGMATFMAPASFYTVVHLSIGAVIEELS